MAGEVRGDSLICIEKDGVRTIILEQNYEYLGYKKNGWKVVKEDWTKDRIVKEPIDITKEMSLSRLAGNN